MYILSTRCEVLVQDYLSNMNCSMEHCCNLHRAGKKMKSTQIMLQAACSALTAEYTEAPCQDAPGSSMLASWLSARHWKIHIALHPCRK